MARPISRARGPFAGALNDISGGFKLAPLWIRMGLFKTMMRYRRTLLGPFWVASSVIAIGLALAFIKTGANGSGFNSLLPYILSGVMVWSYVGATHAEAANVFVNAAGTIRSQPLPLTFHVLLMVWLSFINVLHGLFGYYMITVALKIAVVPHWTLLIGVIAATVAVIPSLYLIGLISSRFRDMGMATGFVVQLLFFLSPVFWVPENVTGLRRLFVHYNPFAHLVSVIRDPLLGHAPSALTWTWAFGYAAACWIVLVIALAAFRRRVVFWL